jgi:hypothetical protein
MNDCAEMPCESYQAGPEDPILVDAFADAAAHCSLAAYSAWRFSALRFSGLQASVAPCTGAWRGWREPALSAMFE